MSDQIVHPLKLGGAYGSPYSLKMRAVNGRNDNAANVRYRRGWIESTGMATTQ